MLLRRVRRSSERSGRRQRGAAALEFSLSLVFLVPLILGLLDYGYYFWIAVNTVEAAKFGLVTAARTPVGPGNCATAGAAAQAAGTLAATTHLTQTLGAPRAAFATVTLSCDTPVAGPPNLSPTWRMTVHMNFPPIVGLARMPAGSPSGRVRFSTQTLVRWGQ